MDITRKALFSIRYLSMACAVIASLVVVPCVSAQSPTESPADASLDPASVRPTNASNGNLRLLAKPTRDGVILRWAPTTPRAWRAANDVGYVVERAALNTIEIDSAAVVNLSADGDVSRTEVEALLEKSGIDSDELADALDQSNIDRAALKRLAQLSEPDEQTIAERLRQAGVDTSTVDRLFDLRSVSVRPEFESITSGPLRPWDLETWGEKLDPNDPSSRYPAIAAQMLHGESVVQSGTGPYERLKVLSSEYQSRYGFSLLAADLNAVAARGLALRFTDSTATPDRTSYLYRVYPASPPSGVIVDTAYVTVHPVDMQPDLPPLGGQASIDGSETTLRWSSGSPGASSYTAFHVERADGLKDSIYTDDVDLDDVRTRELMGGDFERLTDVPFIYVNRDNSSRGNVVYRDTTTTNTDAYTYRVYGITPFATLSMPLQVRISPRDITPPPAPQVTAQEHVEGTTVRLEWEMPGAAPDDLEGFSIGISNDPRGPFIEDSTAALIPPMARTATDSRAIPHTMNYFIVTAVDTAGNRSASASHYIALADSIPPAAPEGLIAEADTNGIVTVRWNRGSEVDLDGYKVFQADDADDPIVLETGELISDTAYVDTVAVRSLSRDTYYAVEAVDQNYNVSEKSRIHVRLPDVVPPTAPVIRRARPTSESVELSWTASVSEDVARHRVMRRVVGDSSGWNERVTLSARAEAYTDTSVVQGRTYAYRVVAEDSSGLQSEDAKPITARPYDNGIRPGIDALEVDAERGDVRLTWRYPGAADGPYWFIVYRAEGDSDLRRYLTAEEPAFDDPSTRSGDAYRYAVQVMYEDGGQSRLSDVVEVTLNSEDAEGE